MAFWGYRKPNKHNEAKTKPTQPKLATRTKGQTRRKQQEQQKEQVNPNWGLASQKRQNTLRFKQNFRNSDFSQFWWSKKIVTFKAATRWQCRFSSERATPAPRNPYKTSTKALSGESGRTPGTKFPFLKGKMWPNSLPTACIKIYAGELLVCPLFGLFESY